MRIRAPTALLATPRPAAPPSHSPLLLQLRTRQIPWTCPRCSITAARPASSTSSSSSTRWKTRASRDTFAAAARTQGLKSRAAFKLLSLDRQHSLFRPGDTVVDLGFAPGAWSQVAVSRTAPGGRVLGVDVIPAMPPRGASSIQGDFLSGEVREEVRRYLSDHYRGRARKAGTRGGVVDEVVAEEGIASEKLDDGDRGASYGKDDVEEARMVDVVLSDMSAPWHQTTGMWIKSVSNPYFRMMNTSGIAFKDHAGSMDLCRAALTFGYDTLRTGGHFVCKFYQGAEEKDFEMRLKKLFEKVVREKPDASRKESKEAYFVALRRKDGVERATVLGDHDS